MGKGKKKHNLQWVKQTLELKDNHNWRSKPGYKIFVIGRGAVRMDVPSAWILKPQEKSFRFLDKEPPDACLEVSYNLMPPGNYRDLPLEGILVQVADQDEREVIDKSQVFTLDRQTARIVWIELKFMDPDENREAFSRICVGIGSGVQCLITMEFWPEDADRCIPIWEEALHSLVLGMYISDPTTGFARPD